MAASTSTVFAKTDFCVICQTLSDDKSKPGMLLCLGCQQSFCYQHIGQHRQQLTDQLDKVVVEEQNYLHEIISKLEENRDQYTVQLRKDIDDWERSSHEAINQIAERTREKLREMSLNECKNFQARFTLLSTELNAKRENETYFENDIEVLKRKFHQLKDDIENLGLKAIAYHQLIFFYIILCASNAQKSIQWAGYQWFLRDQKNSGPGPNNWSSDNVWVDRNNRLHLKLHHSPTTGGWTCAELYTNTKFSFGTFRWFVEGPLDKLDTNVVLGLFTYGGEDGTNEIDIEVAKWGRTDPTASNYAYTIYPRTLGAAKPVSSGTRLSLQGTYTTHQFVWSAHNVALQIQGGFIDGSKTKNLIFSYTTPSTFASAMPSISAPLHMNLWAFHGKPPTDDQEVEIIIHHFEYIKA